MKVVFKGKQSIKEASESVVSIFHLFHERYGVAQLINMRLNVTLKDAKGQDIELVDADTSEVLSTFEVVKTTAGDPKELLPRCYGHLCLVVDNTG